MIKMSGIVNFLNFIKDNWTTIITIVGLLLWVGMKIKDYIKLSKEEKINMALNNAKKICLSLVTKAEELFGSNTGKIKKSYVIDELFNKYPILQEVTNKEDFEKELDKIIEDSLAQMKQIMETKSIKENEI